MLGLYQIGPWWLIARETDSGSYEAPMTPAGRKLTGCHTVFGSLSYCAGSSTVYRYRTRASAARKLRELKGGA